MDQRRWEQIDVVLQQALEIEKGERAPFLDKVCAGDAELRQEVEDLLNREVDTGEFLKHSPPVGVAGKSARQPDALRAGEQISHYRIKAQIGRGGMGEVYLALDERLQRLVAIKTLPAEFATQPERVRRFEQEAIAASKLNHPNIITIFEIVQTDRAFFIATEYVKGLTLRRMLTGAETKQSQRIGVEQALEITIQIASALKAAHTAWIIHRDIKPENIMVRDDGLVKVLDFGIAKLNEEGFVVPPSGGATNVPVPPEGGTTNFTVPGTIIGTASYMSPEQACGEALDGRTDLFSLGAVLYEMVTGERLLGAAPRTEATRTLRGEQEPLPPQAKFDHAPRELERIIRKSLRRKREERYASAGEMLDDLNALKHRRDNRAGRRMAKLGAVAILLAALFVAVAAWLSVNETWEERGLRDGHTAAVRRIAFSPDGRLLVSVGEDQQVIVWDFARRERLKTFTDHAGWVTALAFSPDGKWFATAGADGAVMIWDAVQLTKVAILPGHHGVVRAIAFSSDGRFLVTPTDDDKKNVWAVGRWEKVRTATTYDFEQGYFLLAPNGRFFITPTWTTYDLTTDQPLALDTTPHWAMGMFSPDTERLVSVGSGGAVAFWDTSRFRASFQPKLLSYQRMHQDHGRAVAYSSDGRLAASGAEDIVLWDAVKMTKIVRLQHRANVMSLAFSPDVKWLVSAHSDGAMLLWDVAERELAASFNEHSDSVRSVAFSRDGKRLASAGGDRSVIIWNQADGRKEMVLEGHQRRVMAVAFTPDGASAASCDMDGEVIVWDLAHRRARLKFPSPKKKEDRASYSLAISPNGKWLATSFGVYDLAREQMVVDFAPAEAALYWQIYGVDFSPDGRRLVCVTAQGEALLWDVAQWKLIAERQLPQANLVSVRFSPDGGWLVTGEDQGVVRLWETASLRVRSVIGRHTARVRSVTFSPDGREVASAGEDQTVALWNVSRRELITSIGSSTSPVYAIAFSPDGKQLVAGEHDKAVRLYTRRRALWGWRLD